MGSGVIASVIATEPPIDKSTCVELSMKSLKELANTSLAEVTISIVCEALSAADRKELASRSPELVGSCILMLPDLKEDGTAVDCTSGTMIEILGDRVDSFMKDSIMDVGEAKSGVNVVEPKSLENEKLAKEANTELVEIL